LVGSTQTDSHDTSTENNRVNGTINKKWAKVQSGCCMRAMPHQTNTF
jgi:hypothetical protein